MEVNTAPKTPVRSDAEELAYQEKRRIPPGAPKATRLAKNNQLVFDVPFPGHLPNLGAEIGQSNLFQNSTLGPEDDNFSVPVNVINWFVGLNLANQNSVVNIFRDLRHSDSNG